MAYLKKPTASESCIHSGFFEYIAMVVLQKGISKRESSSGAIPTSRQALQGREAAVRSSLLRLAADESWSVRKLALQQLPRAAPPGLDGGNSETVSVVLDRALDPVAEVRRVALDILPALTDRRSLEFPTVLKRLLALMDPKKLLSSTVEEIVAGDSESGCRHESKPQAQSGDNSSLSTNRLWSTGRRLSRDALCSLREQVMLQSKKSQNVLLGFC